MDKNADVPNTVELVDEYDSFYQESLVRWDNPEKTNL
jgi:hypothetical protein